MSEENWIARLRERAELLGFVVVQTDYSDRRTHDRWFRISHGHHGHTGTAVECLAWLDGWEARAKLV